ncbi:GerMN domain-containing protein [Blastococcus sp. PRF04-17]|uniref:GerMN domain-containing protein n=1 Tax=Blastococcus sp. PRF04-17 TaxID=2933797 RepID=UPI001FF448F0|nr:GerMN domain-containing protein [Blastococcus sp. PRF04-17]UOX99738.1 GerMN domain-containing protein [Blastococcus sp. PRF04-17]
MKRTVRLLTAVLLALVLAGCGVPTGGGPEAIAASDVPYGLLTPPSTSPAPSSSPAQEDRPRVYLVGPDDVLAPSGRDVQGTGLRERLDDLLGQLADGPTAGERDDELTTALPPGLRLSVAAVDEGTVTIDLTGPAEAPSGEQTRLAVGQIVLTATSLPQARAVLLTRDGEPLEAPLPTGELTTEPLTAADYEALLTGPPS